MVLWLTDASEQGCKLSLRAGDTGSNIDDHQEKPTSLGIQDVSEAIKLAKK
jgi:hypothetical protein